MTELEPRKYDGESENQRDRVFENLKQKLLEGNFQTRGTALTEYQIATTVLRELDPAPARSAVVEALGRLETLGLIERRRVPASAVSAANTTKSTTAWSIRELRMDEKWELIRLEHILVSACAQEAIRQTADRPERRAEVQAAFDKLKEALRQYKAGQPPEFKHFLHSYNSFLVSLAEAGGLKVFGETLSNLVDRLSFARVVFPEDLQGLVLECQAVSCRFQTGDGEGARQALDSHFEFFERWFEDALSRLERANAGDAGAVAELVEAAWPMVRRIMHERWSKFPSPRLTSEEEWADLKRRLVVTASEHIHAYIERDRTTGNISTGNISIWFLKLAGYLLRDPAELLDIIEIVCADTEKLVLNRLAGLDRAPDISVSESSDRTARFRGKKEVLAHLAAQVGYHSGIRPFRPIRPDDPQYRFLRFFGWI